MSNIDDVVAVGLDLSPKTLIQAYSQGVFPWPTPGIPLLWYSPVQRAVLRFEQMHVPKRLKQYLQKANWTYSINRAFSEVIQACSRRGDEGTWILPEMIEAYTKLHQMGHAHSVEVWEGRELIGGLYGVDIAGTFAGESMFHLKSNASKAAIFFVASLLKKAGREFMDIQVMSEHMEALGAQEMSRVQFRKTLKLVQENQKRFGPSFPFFEKDVFHYGDFSKLIE